MQKKTKLKYEIKIFVIYNKKVNFYIYIYSIFIISCKIIEINTCN